MGLRLMLNLSVQSILDHQGVHFFQGLLLLPSLLGIPGIQDGLADQGNPSHPQSRSPLMDTVKQSAGVRNNVSLNEKIATLHLFALEILGFPL